MAFSNPLSTVSGTVKRAVRNPVGTIKSVANDPIGFVGDLTGGVLGDVAGFAGDQAARVVEGLIGPRAAVSREGIDTSRRLADGQRNYANSLIRPDLANAQTNESRGQFLNALNLQQQAAMGQAPSVAQLQQQQGLEQALQAQLAAANSVRGGRGAQIAAARNAAMQGANMQQGLINQAAQLRAQEMAQARGDYLQGANMLNAADQNLSTNQGNLDLNFRNLQNQSYLAANQLENQGMQDFLTRDNASQMAYWDAKSKALGGMLNAGGAVGGALAGGSDERLKTNIEDGHADMERFLKSLSVKKYEYKNPQEGQGKFISPMAQDLEKTPVGKKMVKKRPDGMREVQHDAHSLSMILSALGHLNDKIEGRA